MVFGKSNAGGVVGDLLKSRLDGGVQVVGSTVELIKDKLWFASIAGGRPPPTSSLTFLTFPEAHYESFYNDFGPLNLSVLFRFCLKTHLKLNHCKRKPLVFISNEDPQQRLNFAYLIIYHGMTAEKLYSILRNVQPPKFIGFRDASMGPSTYDLGLLDTLRGVQRAVEHNWLDFDTFDCDEYEHYERVENGDFNWLLPGKFLAFCGPHNEAKTVNGYPFHPPETYFDYFRRHRVTTIVRLNKKMYDAGKFTSAGFDHIDLFFVDGSTPSDEIVELFIEACDNAPGALAVHCKAGLGRTGTLIACWMMKEYGITAAECMAWLRICRPGSVIGPQQQFLLEKQEWCWSMGGKSAFTKSVSSLHSPSGKKPRKSGVGKLVYQVDDIKLNGVLTNGDVKQRPGTLDVNDAKQVESVEIGSHQGDRLLALKAAKQHCPGANGDATASDEDDDEDETGVPASASNNAGNAEKTHTGNLLSRALFTSPTTPIKSVRPLPGSNNADPACRNLRFGTTGEQPSTSANAAPKAPKVARVSASTSTLPPATHPRHATSTSNLGHHPRHHVNGSLSRSGCPPVLHPANRTNQQPDAVSDADYPKNLKDNPQLADSGVVCDSASSSVSDQLNVVVDDCSLVDTGGDNPYYKTTSL